MGSRKVTKVEQLAIAGGPSVVHPDWHRRWPEITQADRGAIIRVLDRGVLSGPTAPELSALEREFADYVGVKHCLGLNSGTAALHCCAAAVGLYPGDEVIVPAFTFIASAMGMAQQGAVPVFCDIDPRTCNLDPAKIEERISERTKAIVAVHIQGLPCDMDEITQIARRHALAVIEDAAQAPGASYKGRKVGTFGAAAAFSLNVTKNLSGGEGGLFVTNDDASNRAARRLSVFGEDVPSGDPRRPRNYWSHGLGWNYRSHELPASFARSQLARLDGYNETARRNAEILTAGLTEVVGVSPPHVPPDRRSVYHKYRVRLESAVLGVDAPPTEVRDWVLAALRAEGLAVGLWQEWPLPALPAFRRKHLASWCDGEEEILRPWDPHEFPESSRLLAESFILGTEETPLFVQEPALMESYVAGVAKVLGRIHEFERLPSAEAPA